MPTIHNNTIPSFIFDTHVHVGQFFDDYYSPEWLINTCKHIGISAIAVSSTTTCEENYDKVLHELTELQRQDEIVVCPILWVSPYMLQSGGIKKMLDSTIQWKCIKVHNYQQKGAWGDSTGSLMMQVVSLAQRLHVPILLHTGNEYCYPDDYLPLIEKCPEQIFILAHSRPVDQTINAMLTHPNVWADTAFTPIFNIKQLVDAGLTDRILWGTDLPIVGYYASEKHKQHGLQFDFVTYYNSLLMQLRKSISEPDFEKLTYKNPCMFYNKYTRCQ